MRSRPIRPRCRTTRSPRRSLFLEWLRDDNFTFLGVRDYRLEANGNVLAAVANSSLGVLRGDDGETIAADGGRIEMSPRTQAAFKERRLLLITKTNTRSRVHRRVAMDHVGVKHYDRDGRLTGGFQIVGLFTATAYTRSTRNIPYLRRTVGSVLARAGFSSDSHSGRTLANVLDTYPRDELFQIDADTLFHFASIILQLSERPRVRVLPRYDWFERFVSVLVYVPREPYGSGARAVIGRLLAAAFGGDVASFVPYFPDGPLVRVHFIIARGDGPLLYPDRAQLEAEVSRVVKTWPDLLLEALAAAHDPIAARDLFARYGEAFSPTYRDAFAAATAVQDIATIEAMSAEGPLGVDFQRGDAGARLKLWSHGRPLPLSERVPVLEHMGFTVVDESTYHAEPHGPDAQQFWLHDMLLEFIGDGAPDFEVARPRLDDCFGAVMCGDAESDGYNALVLVAGLTWRRVALLRTLSRYLRQIGVPYSQDYMSATLVRHAGLAARVVGVVRRALRSRARDVGYRTRGTPGHDPGGDRCRARQGPEPRRRPHPAPFRQCGVRRRCAPITTRRTPTVPTSPSSPSSSTAARSTACRCRGRASRFSSARHGWRRCICGSGRWRAAASGGRTGRRIFAPRCSASSRRSRSRTPSSSRSAPRAASSPSACRRAIAMRSRTRASRPTASSCRRCST